MGIGKLARGLGKVGMLIEAGRLAYLAGAALVRAVKGRRDAQQERSDSSMIDPLPATSGCLPKVESASDRPV